MGWSCVCPKHPEREFARFDCGKEQAIRVWMATVGRRDVPLCDVTTPAGSCNERQKIWLPVDDFHSQDGYTREMATRDMERAVRSSFPDRWEIILERLGRITCGASREELDDEYERECVRAVGHPGQHVDEDGNCWV